MGVKCSVYIATSVDGFIAEADGGVEWLHRAEYEAADESDLGGSDFGGDDFGGDDLDAGDFGYGDFMSTVDALVMGRNTYEKVLTFPEWPYDKQVVVLTSGEIRIPGHLQDRVTTDAGPPGDVVARLGAAGKRHLYIDGGVTIQRFLQAGLVHELTLTRIPVLLGGGLSLFGAIGRRVHLRLLASKPFDNGFVQVKYEAVYDE